VEHTLAIAQPFIVSVFFLVAGILAMIRGREISGLPLVGVGLLVISVGEPFLGMARLEPDWIQVGNYVQGTTVPVGAALIAAGLFITRPRSS